MDIKKIAQVFLSMVSIPNSSFPREIKDLIKKYLIESMPDKYVYMYVCISMYVHSMYVTMYICITMYIVCM